MYVKKKTSLYTQTNVIIPANITKSSLERWEPFQQITESEEEEVGPFHYPLVRSTTGLDLQLASNVVVGGSLVGPSP